MTDSEKAKSLLTVEGSVCNGCYFDARLFCGTPCILDKDENSIFELNGVVKSCPHFDAWTNDYGENSICLSCIRFNNCDPPFGSIKLNKERSIIKCDSYEKAPSELLCTNCERARLYNCKYYGKMSAGIIEKVGIVVECQVFKERE